MGHTIAAVRGAEGLLLNGRETRTARGRTDPEHIRATADAAAAVKAPLDIEVPASGTGVMPISTRAKFFATLVAPPHPVMARAPLDRENQIGLYLPSATVADDLLLHRLWSPALQSRCANADHGGYWPCQFSGK